MSTSVSGLSTNFFPSPQNGFTTTTSAGILAGATTVPLNSVSGYTNGDIFVGVIEPTSAANKQTFTGVVDTAGVQITSVVWTAPGANVAHSIGSTVVDYATATHIAMITKGIRQQHKQSGAHSAITSDSIVNAGALTTTGAFTQTGATVLNGSWDGWVGANESWAFASSTTITVPTDATTKYDIGDYIKLTQSATVKYFVITGLTATVLTVAGLAGVTVANSAITANAYSKAQNPHGNGLNGAIPYNPYKFSAYPGSAQPLTAGVAAKVAMTAENFDTHNDFDSTTNYRYTAPIAGFYQINMCIEIGLAGIGAGASALAYLFKNGAEIRRGQSITGTGDNRTIPTSQISDAIQLAAGDYLEAWALTSDSTRNISAGPNFSYFSGFLVSAL